MLVMSCPSWMMAGVLPVTQPSFPTPTHLLETAVASPDTLPPSSEIRIPALPSPPPSDILVCVCFVLVLL